MTCHPPTFRFLTALIFSLLVSASLVRAQSLTGLRIEGPDQVIESSTTLYSVIAEFDNGWEFDVTLKSFLSVDPGEYAEIGIFGDFAAGEVNADAVETIHAVYTFGADVEEASLDVTVLDVAPAGFALDFGGNDDFVELPNAVLPWATSPTTVEVWFKTSNWGVIFSHQNAPPFEAAGDRVPIIYVGQDGLLRAQYWWGTVTPLLSTSIVNDNDWHHVAITYDQVTFRLLVDGLMAGEKTTGLTELEGSVYFEIGNGYTQSWPSTNNNWFGFTGTIDDFRIWNVARTECEINVAMHQRLEGNEPSLLAYWRFDEAGGQIAIDSSPFGNHGTLGTNASPEGDESDPLWIESGALIVGGELMGVEIDGPDLIDSAGEGTFSAVASYEEGPLVDVTQCAEWSIEPDEAGAFDAAGHLVAGDAGISDLPAVISATVDDPPGMVTGTADVTIATIIGPRFALDFDGNDDDAVVQGSATIAYPGSGGWTVEAWVLPHDIVPSLLTPVVGQISIGIPGRDPYFIALDAGDIIFRINEADGSEASIQSPIEEGAWHHVAGVYDSAAGMLQLYVNGDLTDELATAVTIESNEAFTFLMGGEGPGLARHFDGVIDEVRIWAEARTDCEINANMHRRLRGDEANLRGYWRLDAGEGQTVTDHSPFGNHGELGANADPGGDLFDPVWVESGAPLLLPIAEPPVWSDPVLIPEVSSGEDWQLDLSADGLDMYIGSERDGFAESDIYFAHRESIDDQFSTPVVLEELSIPGFNNHESTPRIVAGNLRIYLTRFVGSGPGNIFVADRETLEEPWNAPVPIPELATGLDERMLTVTHDDRNGVFVANWNGPRQLWTTSRPSRHASWGDFQVIDGLAGFEPNALDPRLTANGLTLYFSGIGEDGVGGFDIWKTTRPALHEPFGKPALVAEVSSVKDEFDVSISPDGQTLHLVRQLASNAGSVYVSELMHQGPVPPVGDLNCDGFADLRDYAIMADCIAGPAAPVGDECAIADLNGNGRVDLADVAVFQNTFTGK